MSDDDGLFLKFVASGAWFAVLVSIAAIAAIFGGVFR